jgi:hypothetical protein
MRLTAVKSRVIMNYTDGLIWQEPIASYFVALSHLSAGSLENYENSIRIPTLGRDSIRFTTESEADTVPLCYACRQ